MRRSIQRRFKEVVVGLLIVSLTLMPVNSTMADGLTGGVVVDGAASISTNGAATTINQSTQNAIINWNSFNIGASESATFNMPSVNSAVLNRVTGGDLSTIAGQLNANGQVYLVNPAGVVFANGATVNVGGITASTLDVSNQQFMQGGTLNFSGDSNAAVINNAIITASDGDINLFAAEVQNHGTLAASGMVNLGAGHDITLNTDGSYTINGANGAVRVLNTAIINGGQAMLAAGAGSSGVKSGLKNATMVVEQNGRIYLGDHSTSLEMTGGAVIVASGSGSPSAELSGGTAEVANASISTNGPGGTVEINSTDATTVLDSQFAADKVSILSDGTAMAINVTASGHLRLDPVNVTAGGLMAGSISIDTATAGDGTGLGPGLGNITITGDLEATDVGTGGISLLANNDIITDAVSLITAGGDVTIIGDADLSATGFDLGGEPSDNVGAVFLDGTSIFTEGGDVLVQGIGHNSQGGDGLIVSGVGVTLSGATIDTRIGTTAMAPVHLGAGGIRIAGAGNLQSRGGFADVGGNIGVLITDGSSLLGGGKANVTNDINNDILIKGFGGGLPDSDILDAADPFAALAANYGNENAGVVLAGGSTVELIYDLTGLGGETRPTQDAPGFDDPELHILGYGGNGFDRNVGVLIDEGSSVIANDGDLTITGHGGGVGQGVDPLFGGFPNNLSTILIEDELGAVSGDPVGDFGLLFSGVENAGVVIGDGSTVRLNFELPTVSDGMGGVVNRRRFDDVTLNHEPIDDDDEFNVDPILLITGVGGVGKDRNAGVAIDTTALELASDAHVTITGIGGGLSEDGIRALIMNTDLNDTGDGDGVSTVSGLDTFDFIDVSNQDVIDAIAMSLGADNAGIAIVDSTVAMGGTMPAGPTDDAIGAGDGRPVGESTGRLTLNGFGGLGKDTNYGVRIQGDGAGVTVESGDLYVNAYGGGTSILPVLDSDFYGSGDDDVIFSPRNTDDEDADRLYPQMVQAFDLDWDGGIPDLNNGAPDLILDSVPNAVDFITRDMDDMFVNAHPNDRVAINNILERDLTGAELMTLYTLFGDDNHGLSVEGLGAFIEGTSQANLFLDGHGGIGRSNNHGVYLSGLGAKFAANRGNNINQDGVRNVNDTYNIDGFHDDDNLSRNGIAGLNIDGVGGGITSEIVQGMISNASKLDFVDPDNPQFAGVGDDTNDHAIAPAAVVSNPDLIKAIFDDAEGVYGGDNKGVFATGLGVTLESVGGTRNTIDGTEMVTVGGTDYEISDPAFETAMNDPGLSDADRNSALAQLDAILRTPGDGATGNVAIAGLGGFGKSNNMGVHVTGLGATIQTEGGNMDIFAHGGGIPDDVLAIDVASNGIVVNNTLHIKVDKLFERDMAGTDLGNPADPNVSVGPTAIYGDENRGFFLEGLGAKAVSKYAEPSFIAGDVTSAPIRDNNGYFLQGRYDENGNFIPVLPGGYHEAAVTDNLDSKAVLDHLGDNSGTNGSLTRHPDARHLQIVGAGGTGTNKNTGVEINGLGAKVETDSADIHIEGKAGGVSTTVAQSIIENAKDTFFDVPNGTTDRTDLFYGGFENVDGLGIADVDETDPTTTADDGPVVGNGVHVATDTRDLIQALDQLYGDDNEGVVITGLGAKVHAKTGTAGMVMQPDPATTLVEVPPGLIVTVDGTDYAPGSMIPLADLQAATSVTGAPSTPIMTDDEGAGGDIDAAVAAGAAAEADGATAAADGDAAAAMGDAAEATANTDAATLEANADADVAAIEGDAASDETALNTAADTSTDPTDADPNAPGSLAEQGQVVLDDALADGADVQSDAETDAQAIADTANDPALNGTDAGDMALADGEAAVADGETAAADGEAAVDAAVADGEMQTDDFLTALSDFIAAVEAASEPTVTPGSDPATTAGNVFITGTGGYGESKNNGIRVDGLGAKVVADLGNIHMNGFGGGLPEDIFVIQGDGHVQGGFAGSFGPSEYETTVTAANRNYRTDRLFEVDFDVNDWDFLVAPPGPAPNGVASDGLYGDGNEGIIVTGLGAAVISDFKEPAALRAFYRAQDSTVGQGGQTAEFKFAHSYLSPDATGGFSVFENYNGYNDSQETGQGDAAWVGVDGNDNLVGNGIVGNVADDFQFLDSPVTQTPIGNMTNPVSTANSTGFQDNLDGSIEVAAIGNGGTSLDVIAGGLSGTDATNKGELVLVDPNRLDVQAYTIARGDGELLAVDGVTQNLAPGIGSFTGAGDNFSDDTYLIGVNDNARLLTDAQGNLINTNQLVDGPGAGYQQGIAVLQKRLVEMNGVGGFGRSDNHGVRVDGLGAKVTSLAATIDIEGSGGGIQSNVIRSAIENFADVTPVVLPNGVGTDRIADFSADDYVVTGSGGYGVGIMPGSDGIADLDQVVNSSVGGMYGTIYSPDQLVDNTGDVNDPNNNANLLVGSLGPGGPPNQDLFNDMLEVRLTSDQIMGGTDAGGTQGLVNWYGDNNQGVLVTGLGAKVEATLTSADLWAAINGDAEALNPLGTNGTELFNYTTGDPNYVELVAADGSVTHPLAATRELSLDALEDETFMMLTGNLNNSATTMLQDGTAIIPSAFGDGIDLNDPAAGMFNSDANIIGSIVDHQFDNAADVPTAELTSADLTNESAAVTRAAIAEASDTIIVTARESRANVSIIGHGGAGKGDNFGVHLLGLGVKAVAGTALAGKDAGNIVIDGIGGGIPSGLNGVYGIGDNVVAIDHPENFITDKLLEADFSGTALKDPVFGIPALYGDNNMGFELNGLGAKVESQFDEPFVAIGPINPKLNPMGTTLGNSLAINEHNPDPLRTFIHREDDHTIYNSDNNRAQLGMPVVASRDVQITGDGGTGTSNNKGVHVTGLGAKIESVSADIFVLGNTRQRSGIPSAVIQSMIENASDVIWDIPGDDNEDNDRIADRNPVSNLDLLEAIAMTYGDDNRGVHVVGLGAKIESTDTDVSSFVSNFDNPAALDVSTNHFGVDDHNGHDNFGNNKGTGNIYITGYGGNGQSNNTGFEIDGLGVKVQSGVGNIFITGEGGGVPTDVLAMDNNSIGDYMVFRNGIFGPTGGYFIGGQRNYLVDKLFERDFSSTDLDAFYTGPTAIYGSNNKGIVVTGLGAKVQSDYVEPIAGSGGAPGSQSLVNSIWRERHIRNLNGEFLTGDYTGGDTWTADAGGFGFSEHPLARRVTLRGDGGYGIDNNMGVEVNGLGAKVQSESADISLLGNTSRQQSTYGIPDSVVVSIIENANDTTPIRDGDGNLLTDRTDGVFPGFVVGVEGTTARDVIFDTTGTGFIGNTVIEDDVTLADNGFVSTATTAIDHVGNTLRYSGGTFDGEGIHVAARNDALINLLDGIYGDNNRGVYVTGLGAKVHSVNADFGGNITITGYGGRGEKANVGYELNGLGVKTVAEHGNVWINGYGGGVPSSVLAIDSFGNGRADKLFEVDMDAADLALFASKIYDNDNRGVYITGLGAKVQSNFKEPAALRRFVDPETGYVKYAFAYNDPFDLATNFHGEPKNFGDYGSPNNAQELGAGDWNAEDQTTPIDLGYAGLDIRTNGLSGTTATERGELVLVDAGNEDRIGAYLIPDAYGEFQDVRNITDADNFLINGDNLNTETGYLVGVNDNGRVTTDGNGNIINNSLLVDGPGAGYQHGVAVVQTRDVVINGWGGTGNDNNTGVEVNGLGAQVTSLAADIAIRGEGGGIPSDVIRSIVENGADITPIAGADRTPDFSQDIEILDVTAFDGLDNTIDGNSNGDIPTEFNNGEMIGGSNFVADLDEFIPTDTHVQGYVPGHDGIVDNSVLTNPLASMGASGNVVNDTADDIPDDLRRQRVVSADILSTLTSLYGKDNKGVFITGLGAKVESNLTAGDLVWHAPGDLGEAGNPLGTLGIEEFNYTLGDPNGNPMVNDDADAASSITPFALNALEDETFATLTGNLNNDHNVAGTVSDGNGGMTMMLTPGDLTNESAAVTRAAIAEAADNIIVTARRSRANVTVIGTGGTGKDTNIGVHASGLGVQISALTSMVGGDAGNILIDGIGGGIPSDVNNFSAKNGNVIAIDHPENGLTDKLLESDFLGADLNALAGLFGMGNNGFQLDGLGAKVESGFVEPYVAIAPINPSVDADAGTLAGALSIDEHQPDPLRSYVYLENNAGAEGVEYGLPIVGSRDVQIIGDGGTGVKENKGVFVTGLGAKIQSESADIYVLGNTRQLSGIPDAVVQSMIENASDVIWNIPGDDNEDNDRIPDNQPVTNSDLIDAIAAIYGDDNRGVHVTGLGTKIVSNDTDVSAFSSNYDDPARLDTSPAYSRGNMVAIATLRYGNGLKLNGGYPNGFGTENFGNSAGTGNVTIVGNGGRGKGKNIGVEQSGLGTTIQSGVGNITILAQGGGVPNEVLAIDGAEGAPLAERNWLVDKLFERDLNTADIGKIKDIFGSENEGFLLKGLGAKVQSDYVETAAGSGAIGGMSSLVNSPWEENYIRDLDGNFLTGGFTLGHNDSAEMYAETSSNPERLAVAGEHPLARRITIIGNGGTGIDKNKGVHVEGLGAKVQSESADITMLGHQITATGVDGNFLVNLGAPVVVGTNNIGGMQDVVIRSLIENAKDTTPIDLGDGLLSDRTDGVFGDFIAQTVVNPAGDPLEGQLLQMEDMTPTEEFRTVIDGTTAIDTETAMGPNARRYSGDDTYDGAGIHVAATNSAVMTALKDLYGDENIGVQVMGLGAKVHSQDVLFGGNIDIAGTGGPGEAMNFGVKVEGLGAKVQADHGSINITGVAGGQPSQVLTINGNGRIDRLFEADFDAADIAQFHGASLLYGNDNTGVRIKGLGAKVESNFKEPPALRAFVDPVTGYTKYAFAYSDPFEVAADFHGEPADFDDYDSPNGSDLDGGANYGGFGMTNGQTAATDKGRLVLVNGDTSNGRLLVPNTYGELEVANQSHIFNDNPEIAGDTAVEGVPVIQMREVNITGTGGNGQNTNYGVQVQGLGAKVASLAADITIDGDAGGIPSDVIMSMIENAADITPAMGRDRTADFDNDVMGMDFIADNDLDSNGIADDLDPMTSGAPTDLLQDAVTSDKILDAMIALYGDQNKGVLVKGLGAKVQATLTPERLPQNSADYAENTATENELGTTGFEEVYVPGVGPTALQDLPGLSPGALSALIADERAQLNRDIAEAADTILLTAQISRADIKITGDGGTGKGDNMGVHVMGLGAKVIADHATAGDAGNIDIDGLGGGIPTDVLLIGNNGLTDKLLETDMTAVDIVGTLPTLFGDNNHGVRFEGLGNGVESTFLEPFVATGAVDGATAMATSDDLGSVIYGNGLPLVAFRTVTIDGEANATIDGVDHVGIGDNKGIFFDSLGTHVESDSANILMNGQGGGMVDQFLKDLITNVNDDAVASTDRINDGTRDSNTDVIASIGALYGDGNKGIEVSSLGAKVESKDTRLSAPNSLVGNVSLVGHAGTGTTDNMGVELNGLGAKISSGVGNVLVEGFGGGVSSPVIVNGDGVVDTVLELADLTPGDVEDLSTESVYGDTNYGVHIMGLGAKVESLFDEPDTSAMPAGHAYSYRGNDVRNPFFLNNMDLPKTDDSGFVRALKTDLDGGPLGLQGRGILRDDLVGGVGKAGEGREVVIAGKGGTGLTKNKGVLIMGLGAQATSIDADIDIDGLAGGADAAVVAALDAGIDNGLGSAFRDPTALLYGSAAGAPVPSDNIGVEINGLGAGVNITDEGVLEINGTGGLGNAGNKGVFITGLSSSTIEEGDITIVGKGGGILHSFNDKYDMSASAGPAVRENNSGFELTGLSVILANFDVSDLDNLYEEDGTGGLLLIDGLVGNNAHLANSDGTIDINSPDYNHDLGADLDIDDIGILIEDSIVATPSGFGTEAVQFDLFGDLDVLIRGASFVGSGGGDVSVVATRHLEVSGGASINIGEGTQPNGDPLRMTLAWDQMPGGDAFRDTTGRLKMDGASFVGGAFGPDNVELRLYGNRRGPVVHAFGTNSEEPHSVIGFPAYGNEIDAGATFNGVPWTAVIQNTPGPDHDPNEPGVNSGDHNLEFCPWEQEQWNTIFDIDGRTAVADSDRFDTTQAPSSYDFGNPGAYTADLTFFYNGPNIHTRPPADCTILPFSCYLRERVGPITYSQMIDSVFGSNGSIEYGDGWNGATGGAMGTGGFSAFGGNEYNVTGPNGDPVNFQSQQSVFEFFENEPAGTYTICGNGSGDGTGAVSGEGSSACTTYEHNPDDPMWRENLQDALDEEAAPAADAPANAKASETDVNLSGLINLVPVLQ